MQEGSSSLRQWWTKLDVEDPVSLEPLSRLPYPPFSLQTSSAAGVHYFDGFILATLLVTRGVFENPNSRTAITREDCKRLDDYLQKNMAPITAHHFKKASSSPISSLSVTAAFDLRNSTKVELAKGEGDLGQREEREERMRRDVVSALHGLFNFEYKPNNNRSARSDASNRSNSFLEDSGRWHVSNGSWRLLDADAPMQEESGPSFPILSQSVEDATQRSEINEKWAKKDLTSSISAKEREDRKNALVQQQVDRDLEASAKKHRELERNREKVFVEQKAKLRSDQKLARAEEKAAEKKLEERQALEDIIKWEAAQLLAKDKEETDLMELVDQQEQQHKVEEEERARMALEALARQKQIIEEKSQREAARKAKEKARKKRQQQKKREKKKEEQRAKAKSKSKTVVSSEEGACLMCAFCKAPIVSVPFERLDLKYCTTKCLRTHRDG